MIGRVEKDEPMPIVMMRPTTSMMTAASDLEPLNIAEVCWTSGSICPEAFRTEA